MPDGLLREGDLDALLVEGLSDALAQQARDVPLRRGARIDGEADVDAVGAERLDAPDLRLGDDVVPLAPDLVGDALDHGARVPQVGPVGDLDVEQGARP